MGWTGIRNTIAVDSSKARRDLVDHEIETSWGGYRVIKSAMKGSTYYGAIQHPSGNVFGLVVLTSIAGNEFMYKEMDESMGPYSYDCPACILKALDPTNDETSNTWRERCMERNNRTQLWKQVKETPGVHIRVTAQGLQYTEDGTELILYRRKIPGHNPYWTSGYYRYPEKTVENLTRGYTDYQIVTPDGKNYCDLNYYRKEN